MYLRSLVISYVLLVSISLAYGACYHSNVIGADGYSHDVALLRQDNKTTVIFGEVVRYSYQLILFYNGSMIKTGSKLSDVIKSYNIINGTSGLIFSSAYGGITYNTIYEQYVVLLPRLSYLNPNYTITRDIMGLRINTGSVSDDICERAISYLSVGRYDIYNNYRYARYSLIILTSLVLSFIIYYSYPSRIVNDRLFRSVVVLFLGTLFGVLGIVFININMETQGIEYSYYIAISIVYFGGFIRYILHKLLQGRTTRFYSNLRTYSNSEGLEGLKTGSRMLTSIENNNALNKFVTVIPRAYTDMVLIMIVMILWIPSVEIITYNTLGTSPYANFMLSITIVEFAVPLCSTFIPAFTIFLWSIYDYIVKGKIKRLGHYFTIAEDPLLYRIEFLGCLMLPLPFSIITFIIGNTDSAIPSYILTARWYQLTFHALAYIAFDLSYLILLSGAVSILGMKIYENRINISDNTSLTTGTGINKLRVTKREKVGLAMLKDRDYYDVIKEYSIKTGSYTSLGVAEWLEGMTDGKMLKIVKDNYNDGPIAEIIMKALMDNGIVTDDDLVLSNNIGSIIKSIIVSLHHNVIRSVLRDGFDQTYDYQEFLTTSSTTLKDDNNLELKENLKEAIDEDAISIRSITDETLSIRSDASKEAVECNKMEWIHEEIV